MGYTHYLTQRKNITALDWQDMQAAFVRIMAKAKQEGLQLCGPDGTGSPEFGSDCLAFNGDESQDCSYDHTSSYNGRVTRIEQCGAHESFVIERKLQRDEREYSTEKGKLIKWTFCKTAEKPYDVAVTAIGCYLETMWPQYFEFSSDGGADDWQAGLALACRAMPEKGNQMAIPAWVQDGERWQDHGISGKRYALKKHIVQGWVIVDQSKPLLAPTMSITEDVAIRSAQQFKSGSWRGDEYNRQVNKVLKNLMDTYSSKLAFVRNQSAESVMLGSLLEQFANIANKQLTKATSHRTL
jgi:hypothetical protein